MKSENRSILSKIKRFANDSFWSLAALMLMNVVAQFIVYPLWSRKFGDEIYGNIVYIMSIINIFAVSIGIASNYARMAESAKRETTNGDYHRILIVGSVLSGVICWGSVYFGNLQMSFGDALLTAVLCIFTLWRYYADVEYRLNLNYKGYFVYYAVISVGYLIGCGLFWVTGYWALALIPGEIFGLLLVFKKGKTLNKQPLKVSVNYKENMHAIFLLIITNFISNTIFNGDRLLLQNLLGGTAVTIYYLSSLIGKTMSLVTTPLNSVIIGHLAQYKGKFNKKMIHVILVITLAAVFGGTIAAVIGSHIVIYVLYPNNYETVKAFFIVANMAQVVYFITNIITTVLLRIAKANIQLIVNAVYAISFLVICIPITMVYGIEGFCVAILIVNVIRYIIAMTFCYLKVDTVEGK